MKSAGLEIKIRLFYAEIKNISFLSILNENLRYEDAESSVMNFRLFCH